MRAMQGTGLLRAWSALGAAPRNSGWSMGQAMVVAGSARCFSASSATASWFGGSGSEEETAGATGAGNAGVASLPDAGGESVGGEAMTDLATTMASADGVEEVVNGLINPGGFSPIYWACDGLQALQAASGLPWWATIVATTVAVRTALLPFAIKQMKFTGRVQQVQPKIQYLTAKMKEHTPGSELHNMYAIQLRDLVQKHDVNPLKMFMFPLIQAPVFISMFMALRRLAENGTFVDGLTSGGALWFSDLSAADPYYVLPLVAGGSFLATVELGAEMPNVQQRSTMKNVMRGLAVVMVAATYSFPASVFMYWISSNSFSLAQAMAFRVPGVKDALGIPPPPDPSKAPPMPASAGAQDAGSAFQELKDAFNKQKSLRDEIKSRTEAREARKTAADEPAAAVASAATGLDSANALHAEPAPVTDVRPAMTAAEMLAAGAATPPAATASAQRVIKRGGTRHNPTKTRAKGRSYGRKRGK
ncbi:inner membrane protein OXA1L [Thecamonas trahens ATCC 50062]|uniref:Inner membrane protein OXA1L n=1 Tax=Thecamonas trahens ATCC 50062 TaxID=461836 RepID=A0A0L0DAR1_THETB|nr:inner membrane protein OXA1L [Thecamonas trahens ATCC 50062]KNC49166.1 inner membrane protein OXA1L [Thecamonas trahens ATCC 50062]|eukprot:XP_013758187.1 inner membrane protein OXA1L [Thecamonas trahens ATCC 50062]